MSYKLYTDKINKFSCTVQVDGTSLANSKVRLVVESEEINYMFDGIIYEGGNCEVTIPKTKNFLPEKSTGIVKLEVIADDVFFQPWSSEYIVETNKKVAVIVQEQIDDKPKITVEVAKQEQKPVVKETVKPVMPKPKQKSTIKETIKPKPISSEQKMKEHFSQLSKKDILELLKNR
jgi:hypothetical protein